MHTIALASRKGGSGKSTLAVHLSVLACAPNNPALLIDTDPQASVMFWFGLRADETPLAASCEARELAATLASASEAGIAWVFVDSPPHNSPAIAEVIRCADLTLIPMRPGAFDLAAAASTIDMAQQAHKRAVVVLNAVPPRRGALDVGVVGQARTALQGLGAEVWCGAITARAALSYALTAGRAASEFDPGSLADFEVRQLWSWIQDESRPKKARKQAREQAVESAC
jgi:chromosome partitioning protein